jgi:hypothetical protein
MQERKREDRKDRNYRLRWQTYTVGIACAKFLTVGFFDMTSLSALESLQRIVDVEGVISETNLAQITAVFFVLLCGNLADNTQSHKALVLVADCTIALFYVLKAVMTWFVFVGRIDPMSTSDKTEIFYLNMTDIDLILTSLQPIITILVMLQLFNWLPQKYLAL